MNYIRSFFSLGTVARPQLLGTVARTQLSCLGTVSRPQLSCLDTFSRPQLLCLGTVARPPAVMFEQCCQAPAIVFGHCCQAPATVFGVKRCGYLGIIVFFIGSLFYGRSHTAFHFLLNSYLRGTHVTAAEVLPSVGKFIKLLPNSHIGSRNPFPYHTVFV